MSATDVAFLTIALMQAVVGGIWLLGSWLIGDTRRATVHWSAFAEFSALGFVLLTTALHAASPARAELLRAAGNLTLLLAMIAMQRGIWVFVGRPLGMRLHGLALAVALFASYIGLSPGGGSFRVGTISSVLTVLVLLMARDLHVYARDRLHFRWPWLMALPGLGAAPQEASIAP